MKRKLKLNKKIRQPLLIYMEKNLSHKYFKLKEKTLLKSYQKIKFFAKRVAKYSLCSSGSIQNTK